ncbi:MAG: hypothetical protein ACP5VR_00985 [Acidimicrobiales bacterium]
MTSRGLAMTSRKPNEPGQAAPSASKPPALAAVVRSAWGWRAMAVFSLLALGLCITFLLDGRSGYGAAWAFITLAWGSFSALLWRRHLDAEEGAPKP